MARQETQNLKYQALQQQYIPSATSKNLKLHSSQNILLPPPTLVPENEAARGRGGAAGAGAAEMEL